MDWLRILVDSFTDGLAKEGVVRRGMILGSVYWMAEVPYAMLEHAV